MHERDIFLAALEIADPAERSAYIDQACGTNSTLRAQVEELLRTHAETSQFLETPAPVMDSEVAQTVITDSTASNKSSPDDDDDPRSERMSGEAEFRKYLQPATRPGWLGRLAHYEIEQILGRGAFGIVAKAFDEKLHRVVAIKLMNPELASTSPPRKRFLREARTAAAVTHENIVAIHAVEEEPIPYLVMEYVPGQTLQQRMDEHGPFEVADVLRVGQQVAAGMAAAHAMKLIHRDIKPANILLTGGINERAKISDFGLARAVDDATLTSSGLIAGTPMYMAPEQARGEDLDHRADMFSLGSVLYQMVSGRPPFRAANTVAVLKRVCEDTPRALEQVIPGTPVWLGNIIFKLMEKDRERRYQSAQEVADLFARCLSELQLTGYVSLAGEASRAAETQRIEPVAAKSSQKDSQWRQRFFVAYVIGLTVLVMAAAVWVRNFRQQPAQPKTAEAAGSQTASARSGSRETSEGSTSSADRSLTTSATQTGWHGWPADAPKPAIAPFDAAQAKQHQDEWAAYLKVPVEYTNSIGMKFRLIPPGEFLMGSTPEEIEASLKVSLDDKQWKESIQSEAPQQKVILTQPIYLGLNEVTQANYEHVMGVNPSHFAPLGMGKEAVAGLETADHPVESVSWNDAAEFCSKLSQQEKLKPFYFRAGETITPLDGTGYRLPSETEWEFACRAGTATKYWIGDKSAELVRAGWLGPNAGDRTHAVRELGANPFGLFDVHGNVWEWVQDTWDATDYGQIKGQPSLNSNSQILAGSQRPMRGGGWFAPVSLGRSSSRLALNPQGRYNFAGFRLLLPVDAVKQALNAQTAATATDNWQGWPADAPKPAIVPFDAVQAKKHQEEWAAYLKVPVEYTNSIGMKFRLIPPGEFQMGSTPEEIAAALKVVGENKHWQECVKSEAPQHTVLLTQAYYLGVNEVTQAEYEKVTGTNPSHFAPMGMGKEAVAGLDTTKHPVDTVSWNNAAEFCDKLSQQEKFKQLYFRSGETMAPLDGSGYRLPSEAEWEFACRAGTTTKYWISDKDEDLIKAGWFGWNSGSRTHAAGELKANPFGLSDIHGNVWEWVQDGWDATYYGQFAVKPAIYPVAPLSAGSLRVLRGGDWATTTSNCRSSNRYAHGPATRTDYIGFRVSLLVDAVQQALKSQSTPDTAATTGWHGWPADAPKPAIAPFDAAQAKQHQEEWAAYLKVPVEYTNSIGMKFRLIPPGEFTMGATPEEIDYMLGGLAPDDPSKPFVSSAGPQHKTILTQPFYLGVTEITQAQFAKVTGYNPSLFSNSQTRPKYSSGYNLEEYAAKVAGVDTSQNPVEGERWIDLIEFFNKLSVSEGLQPCYFRANDTATHLKGDGYRFPTEAQWEFACRAGTTTRFWYSESDLSLSEWGQPHAGDRTHVVGELRANPFGLHDMLGNVSEFTADQWIPDYFQQFEGKAAIDPATIPNVKSGIRIVIRGGHYHFWPQLTTSAARTAHSHLELGPWWGFRAALPVEAVRNKP